MCLYACRTYVSYAHLSVIVLCKVFHDLVRDRLEGRSRKIVKDKMRKVQVDLATAKLRELFGSLAEASKGKEGEPGARSDKPGTGGSGPAKAKDAADGGVAVRDPGDVRAQEPVHQVCVLRLCLATKLWSISLG
jgi:hypothetical protein